MQEQNELTRWNPCKDADGIVGMQIDMDGAWVLLEHVEQRDAAQRQRIAELEHQPKEEQAHVCHACDGTGWTYG
jgi:hypothetical protein